MIFLLTFGETSFCPDIRNPCTFLVLSSMKRTHDCTHYLAIFCFFTFQGCMCSFYDVGGGGQPWGNTWYPSIQSSSGIFFPTNWLTAGVVVLHSFPYLLSPVSEPLTLHTHATHSYAILVRELKPFGTVKCWRWARCALIQSQIVVKVALNT